MTYAMEKLERDLERAFKRYAVRTGQVVKPDIDIEYDRSVVGPSGSIDTENLRRKHIGVNVSVKEMTIEDGELIVVD